MGKVKRAAIAVFIGVIALGMVAAFAVLRGYRSRTVLDYGRTTEDAALLFTDTTLVGRKDGVRLWEIHAHTIRISRDQADTRFDQIRDGTFFQGGKPLFKLSAGRASYNSISRDLNLERGVRLEADNGMALVCDSAHYSGTTDRVSVPGLVEVHLPNGKLTGHDLTSDGGLKEVVMHKIKLTLRVGS